MSKAKTNSEMGSNNGLPKDRVLTVTNLESLHSALKSDSAVVDFWATWCKPCKDVAPKYAELSVKFPAMKFLKCNIADFDEDDLIDMGVENIPAFFVYRDGKKDCEFIGNKCCDAFEKYLVENFGARNGAETSEESKGTEEGL